ncbi:MAG: sugar ABC transporter ATP-binding protein [Thermosphaera sp.]
MEPLLAVRGVSKTFDGVVKALDNVDLEIYPREIVGVVGENGAGKSTLVKILVGIYRADKGELFYLGEKTSFPQNPRDAAERGIALVPQERGVVPHLRVYQFLFLGLEDICSKAFWLPIRTMKCQARDILDELHVGCSVNDYMYELPLAIQKLVEIAKAVLSVRLCSKRTRACPIVILDEPTAPLAIEQRQELFSFIKRAQSSSSFILVSHIIPEVLQFADRLYVLRDGRLVGSHSLADERITEEDVFREIVGRRSSEYLARASIGGAPAMQLGDVVLSVENLTKAGCYYNISFELRKGECVGLAGPAGSGKSEIIRTIAGLAHYDEGVLKILGKVARASDSPTARLERGIGYFSGETGKELFLFWTIAKNISLLNIRKVLTKYRTVSFVKEIQLAQKAIAHLKIKAPGPHTLCYSLSGGNKQKVSVAKWLEKKPDILLLEDPTIGIDVGAREDIYEALLKMKAEGMAMILVSDDPKEYLVLCDRILCLRQGKLEAIRSPKEYEALVMGGESLGATIADSQK